MLLLSSLVEKFADRVHFTLKGYDKSANMYWTQWHGCKWQFRLGRDVCDCEVLAIINDWANDTLIIECDLVYDALGGM